MLLPHEQEHVYTTATDEIRTTVSWNMPGRLEVLCCLEARLMHIGFAIRSTANADRRLAYSWAYPIWKSCASRDVDPVGYTAMDARVDGQIKRLNEAYYSLSSS